MIKGKILENILNVHNEFEEIDFDEIKFINNEMMIKSFERCSCDNFIISDCFKSQINFYAHTFFDENKSFIKNSKLIDLTLSNIELFDFEIINSDAVVNLDCSNINNLLIKDSIVEFFDENQKEYELDSSIRNIFFDNVKIIPKNKYIGKFFEIKNNNTDFKLTDEQKQRLFTYQKKIGYVRENLICFTSFLYDFDRYDTIFDILVDPNDLRFNILGNLVITKGIIINIKNENTLENIKEHKELLEYFDTITELKIVKKGIYVKFNNFNGFSFHSMDCGVEI